MPEKQGKRVFHELWQCVPVTETGMLGLGFKLSISMNVWYGGEDFYWFLAFIHFSYIAQVLPIIFPLTFIYCQIAFLYKVIYTDIFHGRSLSSFWLSFLTSTVLQIHRHRDTVSEFTILRKCIWGARQPIPGRYVRGSGDRSLLFPMFPLAHWGEWRIYASVK